MGGKVAIALDLGGTQVRAAIVDASGSVSNRVAVKTRTYDGPNVIIKQMADAAREASKSIDQKSIVGIGVSSPGPLDTGNGHRAAVHSRV
jgi:glucokinase